MDVNAVEKSYGCRMVIFSSSMLWVMPEMTGVFIIDAGVLYHILAYEVAKWRYKKWSKNCLQKILR